MRFCVPRLCGLAFSQKKCLHRFIKTAAGKSHGLFVHAISLQFPHQHTHWNFYMRGGAILNARFHCGSLRESHAEVWTKPWCFMGFSVWSICFRSALCQLIVWSLVRNVLPGGCSALWCWALVVRFSRCLCRTTPVNLLVLESLLAFICDVAFASVGHHVPEYSSCVP